MWGKKKWWQSRAKTKEELEPKYLILEKLEHHYTQLSWDAKVIRKVIIGVDRNDMQYYPDLKVLMRNLTYEDAVMWAKMME
jgi:hypothetical protein